MSRYVADWPLQANDWLFLIGALNSRHTLKALMSLPFGGAAAHCVVVRLLRVIIVCSLKRLTNCKEETVWNFDPIDYC